MLQPRRATSAQHTQRGSASAAVAAAPAALVVKRSSTVSSKAWTESSSILSVRVICAVLSRLRWILLVSDGAEAVTEAGFRLG